MESLSWAQISMILEATFTLGWVAAAMLTEVGGVARIKAMLTLGAVCTQ